ncbi:MAG TPA: protein kinase [Ktedonobacterales bacterium]|nr:protein kinase [Ktedonobacterales bacterium]
MASKHTSGASLDNGRYELREPIATGGMATVYKAWDTRVERIVAVKVLRSLAKTDRRAIERFRREAHAAARLSHPNAVTIYDFLEERGEHYLIMEFVEGVNLKQYLAQKGTLSPQQAVEITSQVCSVLQVAHANGFIHRDIKPQNIMITPDGQAKLTDFGIVRVMEAAGLTNTGIVLGTADYLAPEQARGDQLSPASDLYSLGVVLYEMLAGRPPFVGTSAVQVAMQHTTSVPPPPSKYNPRIPRALELVVKKALQKEPERRYTNAEAMRKALMDSLKKSIEEGATIPGYLPAVDQSPNRRATMPGVGERPEHAARPQPHLSPDQPLMPPGPTPTRADAEASRGAARWTSLVIIIVVIILVISLALGLYFAFIKPSGLAPASPLAEISQMLAAISRFKQL